MLMVQGNPPKRQGVAAELGVLFATMLAFYAVLRVFDALLRRPFLNAAAWIEDASFWVLVGSAAAVMGSMRWLRGRDNPTPMDRFVAVLNSS